MLTTAERVRLMIQDQAVIADATYASDGQTSAFALPHRSITSATAFVTDGTGWSATGATFDPTGTVTFSDIISANSGFRARYVHSTFSDDEIETFVSAGGGVNGAALQAVQALMFDGLKRASWAAPDGTRFDDTHALSLLRDLHDRLQAERDDSALDGGGVVSWSLGQGA